MSGNGEKEGGVVRKRCPFGGGWCIGEVCEVRSEMTNVRGGVMQKVSMCSLNAMVVLLSEVNAGIGKLLQQKQGVKLQIPGIRG